MNGHFVSCAIENLESFCHSTPFTIDDDGGSRLYVVTSAAVRAAILRQCFPNEQLQLEVALPQLVLLSVAQHTVALLPLHLTSCFGDLTAQGHPITFLHLDVLQLLKEFDGLF